MIIIISVCGSAADRWIHSDCVEIKTQETRWRSLTVTHNPLWAELLYTAVSFQKREESQWRYSQIQ